MTGVILFAHGSPVNEANQGVHDLAATIQAGGPYSYVRAAFLDGGKPDLSGAVTNAAAAGIDEVIVIPYFLTVGLHLQRDMPKLVAAAQQSHPGLKIVVAQSLEGHPLMPSLILSRVKEALHS